MNIQDMKAGAELDALVATQVMGWRVGPATRYDMCGNDFHYQAWVWPSYNNDSDHAHAVAAGGGDEWSPSTNIAHAWEVVERMTAGNDRWFFSLEREGDDVYTAVFAGPHVECSEEAAPLAISIAALKAITS